MRLFLVESHERIMMQSKKKKVSKNTSSSKREWMSENNIIYYIFILGVLVVVLFACLFCCSPLIFRAEDIFLLITRVVLDVLLFGVIIEVINFKTANKEQIKKYKEEIEDCSNWDSKEATNKILRNIKKLQKKDEYEILLKNCYLEDVRLIGLNFSGSIFNQAKLKNAILKDSNFNGCHFKKSSLINCNLNKTQCVDVNFTEANLSGANLSGTNLSEANLSGANLSGANLSGVILDNAIMYDVELDGAKVGMIKWFEFHIEKNEDSPLGMKALAQKYRVDPTSMHPNHKSRQEWHYLIKKREIIDIITNGVV